MRIQPVSDLHLELPQPDYELPAVGAHVRVLAGDIQNGVAGIEWAAAQQRDGIRTIYVPGNHEFYGGDLNTGRQALRQAARENGIDLLDGDTVVIQGVRFVGTTLWAAFELLGAPEAAMETAGRKMGDYRHIGGLTPVRAREMHWAARAWLEEQLATHYTGPTVIVTHHAPHPGSVPQQHRGHPLSPAYVSDLSEIIERYQPALWLHGHVHYRMDYMVGATRIVCNPRGYYPSVLAAGFDAGFVVELDSPARQ